MAFGGYAEVVCCPAEMAFEMPEEFAEPAATAIYLPFHLSWLALHTRARLQAGETLLVVGEKLRPGMTTREIDEIVHEDTLKRGGSPAPLN